MPDLLKLKFLLSLSNILMAYQNLNHEVGNIQFLLCKQTKTLPEKAWKEYR